MVDHIHLDNNNNAFPFKDCYKGLFILLFMVIVHTSKKIINLNAQTARSWFHLSNHFPNPSIGFKHTKEKVSQ
jgi:hypothetical protein